MIGRHVAIIVSFSDSRHPSPFPNTDQGNSNATHYSSRNQSWIRTLGRAGPFGSGYPFFFSILLAYSFPKCGVVQLPDDYELLIGWYCAAD
jgi:hypothetical protein